MAMSEDIAEKMARLVMAVERSRAEDEPPNRPPVGAELQAVIELAEQFPQAPAAKWAIQS